MSSKSYFKFILVLGIVLFFFACSKEENGAEPVATEKQIPETKDYNDDSDENSSFFHSKYIIAHRGFHGRGVPENSKESLIKALDLGVYGTEFDVWQTKDDIMVINHNETYHGMVISNSIYEDLSQYSLNNGEPLPLLEDFLMIKKEKGTNVKLIIEIKDCNVSELVSLVDKYDLQNEVEYISFGLRFCNQLVDLGYGDKTYYLGGRIEPANIKKLNYGGIDYNYTYYDSNENWVAEAKALNLKTIVWTVNDMEKLKDYVQKEVIVTTDNPQKGYDIEKELFYEQNNIQ
jgi:glycerophosphoryl diester phosphodiesterase